ncbi:MAG: serine/threonine protein kinase, partial [Chloroflexi bacterium]|nr:serine/threonine protein kinase [Chloroflexota bacterium]
MVSSSSLFCATCGAANTLQATTCFACGQSLLASENTEQPAARLILRQRYRTLCQLGQGGMGAVYKAEDIELGDRIVAVKEMSLRALSQQEEEEAAQAFKREALLLAGLMHPNLPRIYDHFAEAGRWYLVMDFIEGETLEDYLGKAPGGKLPVKEVLEIGIQLCTVLDYLHTRQPAIIFRDLKPSNIMRTPAGQLYLIDFGIARHFKPGQAKDTTAFGSPGYAAPEQYGKTQTTPSADLYSLGALLHEALTGIDPSITPFFFAPLDTGPAALQTLLTRMLDMDIRKRP